ncbi:hypothetical protein FOA52_005112 [Chlamydomonas sp. UWO 241]|nr:hypothetical protein FOA52_005112 [Chlamydomonas sp. UWO 241]
MRHEPSALTSRPGWVVFVAVVPFVNHLRDLLIFAQAFFWFPGTLGLMPSVGAALASSRVLLSSVSYLGGRHSIFSRNFPAVARCCGRQSSVMVSTTPRVSAAA